MWVFRKPKNGIVKFFVRAFNSGGLDCPCVSLFVVIIEIDCSLRALSQKVRSERIGFSTLPSVDNMVVCDEQTRPNHPAAPLHYPGMTVTDKDLAAFLVSRYE